MSSSAFVLLPSSLLAFISVCSLTPVFSVSGPVGVFSLWGGEKLLNMEEGEWNWHIHGMPLTQASLKPSFSPPFLCLFPTHTFSSASLGAPLPTESMTHMERQCLEASAASLCRCRWMSIKWLKKHDKSSICINREIEMYFYHAKRVKQIIHRTMKEILYMCVHAVQNCNSLAVIGPFCSCHNLAVLLFAPDRFFLVTFICASWHKT